VTAVILTLIPLAAGLDDLTFRGAEWFDIEQMENEMLGGLVPVHYFFLIVFYIAIALIIFMTGRYIWQRFLPALGIVVAIVLIMLGVVMPISAINTELESPQGEEMTLPEGEEEIVESEAFDDFIPRTEVSERPAWVAWLAAGFTAVVITSLLAAALWFVWQKTADYNDPLAELAAEAQTALKNLRSGDALRDVIIRCYLEMARTLDETRKIQREKAVTPREFERQLIALGLPADPVANLTRLFESVRYGAREASPEEQAAAVASLEAIIAACQE
jgi:hypothetical protein